MYCANCGSELQKDFCTVCGSATVADARSRDSVTGLQLAGWGRRVVATLIDALVLLVPDLLLWALTGTIASWTYRILAFAIQSIYLVWLLSLPSGQTIGNRVAKTKVVDATTGQPLTLSLSLKRWGLMAIFSLSIYLLVGLILEPLDALWPLWDTRRQTLHDKFAGTIVVLV